MTDAVETMAWSGEVPWHGLGVNVTGKKMTPAQIAKAAKIDWTVSKRPLYTKASDGKLIEIPGERALTRDSDEAVLDIVGKDWKEVQNHEAIDFFQKFTKAGHMEMETAGSLWGGRYIWALAKVGEDFTLGKNDHMKSYLLISSPHKKGVALVIKFTPIRVVCWNTLSWALGQATGNTFRMPHTQKFDEATKAQAEAALGLAKKETASFKEAATLLTKKKAKAEEVEQFFCEVLQYDPKAKKSKDKETVREPLMLPDFRLALTKSPGATMPTALGTWWGALNAVTFVVDQQKGQKGDASMALKNKWFGHHANIKERAFDLAIERAK